MDSTKTIIMDYIRTEFLRSRGMVKEDQDLLASGVIDSLGILQLVSFIEDQFGVKVPDEDVVLENFQSVNALAGYLNQSTAPASRNV